MGVRIALGARPRTIVSMVVRQGVVLATLGVAGGIMVAILVGTRLQICCSTPRRVTSPSSGAQRSSSSTAAAAASFWPALRAGRVDPMRALKSD